MIVDPKYLTLSLLLEQKLFRVPQYQRTYSWESKQRQDLFSDIENLLNYKDDRHHFMATIVCLDRKDTHSVGADEFNTLEVVDGQQRITTLIILLKAIAKDFAKNKKERKEIEQLLVKADKRLILLQINHDSNEIFTQYIKHGKYPALERTKTQAEYNLISAFIECENFVASWKGKGNLIDLLRLLRHRLGFVFYLLEKEGLVYTVFEVLNSRGLDVDWIDKCKSMLMGIVFEQCKGKIAKEHLEALHQIWSKIYEMLGKKLIPGHEILRVAATLKHDPVPSKLLSAEDSYEYFKILCSGDFKKVVDICEWLQSVAGYLNILYSSSRLSAVTDIAQARLLAVAILNAKLTNADKNDVLHCWERVTFKIFGLSRKDDRTGVGGYIRVASKIYKNEVKDKNDIIAAIEDIGGDYPVEAAILGIKGKDCYNGWENDLRYLLFRYEECLCSEKKRHVSEVMWEQIWSKSAIASIEHIHPQTRSYGWKGKLCKGGATLGKHIHRLGNLTLLPPYENSKLLNKSFSEKRKIYETSGLRISEEIASAIDWTKETIDKREEKLITWIKEYWHD